MATTQRERRKGTPPIPDNLESLLTPSQLSTLREMEAFGWQVCLVRRPLFVVPTLVLRSRDGSKLAVIEEDGTANYNPDITIR